MKDSMDLLFSKAEKALRQAVKKVIADRKMRGWPLVVWENGKVVKIPASKL